MIYFGKFTLLLNLNDFFAFVVPLILVIFGTFLGGLLLWKIFDMVRSSIKGTNPSIDAEDFDRLARAFIQNKKEMRERIQHLEAVIADEDQDDFARIEEAERENALSNELNDKNKIQS